METMTSRERIARVMQHEEPDRVPILDGPWGATVERWHREGMPEDVDWCDFFGVDKVGNIGVAVGAGMNRFVSGNALELTTLGDKISIPVACRPSRTGFPPAVDRVSSLARSS